MLLVAGAAPGFNGAVVVEAIRRGVEAAGAAVAGIEWREVPAIPRTATGKAPLVRAGRGDGLGPS